MGGSTTSGAGEWYCCCISYIAHWLVVLFDACLCSLCSLRYQLLSNDGHVSFGVSAPPCHADKSHITTHYLS